MSLSVSNPLNLQVRLMLLAALSGEHILFIGPPGTAKSELGRRLSRLYNGPFFERLLTRFSVPEVRLADVGQNFIRLQASWRCFGLIKHVFWIAQLQLHLRRESQRPQFR